MRQFFSGVKEQIKYEGADSKNPLAFRYYDADSLVGDKTMRDHLRFSVAYWHTMQGGGADIFGGGTFNRPWQQGDSAMLIAKNTLYAAFEFFTKLGAPYYCFHDRDIAPEGETFSKSCENLQQIIDLAEKLQADTGIKLLWGTANLFSHPRYAHGAATNPDANVFAYASAQVKHAMDATMQLGGENYVFWGGREGYETLLNTDLKHEHEQLARFFHQAVAYKRQLGFTGQLLIEPKPKEPTVHQYDFDSATVLNFLREYELLDHFKLNIEANHATLAGHTFEHELSIASAAGKLGSLDANTGHPLLGWDTDQFPSDLYSATYAMLIILKQGGIGRGGCNFDAKLRRSSTDLNDLFYGHIGAMDTFAKGLLIADKIKNDGLIDDFINERYISYKDGIGAAIMSGSVDMDSLDKYTRQNGEPKQLSGKQEYLENIINRYIL